MMNKNIDYMDQASQKSTFHMEVSPNLASDIIQQAATQQYVGQWEGYAKQVIKKDQLSDNLLPMVEGSESGSIDFRFLVRFNLDVTKSVYVAGYSEVVLDFRPYNINIINNVYIDIDGKLFDNNKIIARWQNIEDNNHYGQVEGSFNEDGRTIIGGFQAMTGVQTRIPVDGNLFLEKIPQEPLPCESISPQRGLEALNIIWQAKHTILATHFSPIPPYDEYISLLLQKMKDEVSVIRIVQDSCDESLNWLYRFRNNNGCFLPFYNEYKLNGIPFPSDIIVVDDEVALQVFFTLDQNQKTKV